MKKPRVNSREAGPRPWLVVPLLTWFLLSSAAFGQSGAGNPHPAGEIHPSGTAAASILQDVSRRVNNPLSTLWTLQNQFDINTIDDIPKGGGGTADGRRRASPRT